MTNDHRRPFRLSFASRAGEAGAAPRNPFPGYHAAPNDSLTPSYQTAEHRLRALYYIVPTEFPPDVSLGALESSQLARSYNGLILERFIMDHRNTKILR